MQLPYVGQGTVQRHRALTYICTSNNFISVLSFLQHLFLPFQVRRLKEFGVTMGEMTRYMDALIKDSEQLAMMIDSVPSVDNLDFIMESDALGHTVMDQLQGHESLLAVAETVTLEEVPSFFFVFVQTAVGMMV